MPNKQSMIEYRNFELDSLEIEKRADGDDVLGDIVGHAAVFDKLSKEMWGFREKIAPGAFSDVLNDDVRALFNHDPNIVLGRTKSKTLTLEEDKRGLKTIISPPNTQQARDLIVSIKRGDISQMSFAFSVESETWEEKKDKSIVRTINKYKRLYDVSPVTYPAYPQTDVKARAECRSMQDVFEAGRRFLEEQKKSGRIIIPVGIRLRELDLSENQ